MFGQTNRIELAIIGGGPIGIEAAIYARSQDWDVHVFERASVGANLERWSHVEFFSPWHLNRSRWGESTLRALDAELAPDDTFPTARNYLERYLRPLANSPALEGRVHEECDVDAVARSDQLKGENIGAPQRRSTPFVLRVETDDDVRYIESNVLIDATGAYDMPNGLGPGGLHARGESEVRDSIEYYVPDVLGDDRETYRGRTVLVVGAGYSAATTLRHLHQLASEAPETRIVWCRRSDSSPYDVIPDDPLPMRRDLAEFGNAVARGDVAEIDVVTGTVRALNEDAGGRLRIRIANDDEAREITIDRVVANVGYRPNLEIFRELQAHQCWATEGPIDLAASLLASGSTDCLDQSSQGVEQLEHPEPDFYILGSKSYGRNSTFLLDVGFEQIKDVFEAIDRSVLHE